MHEPESVGVGTRLNIKGEHQGSREVRLRADVIKPDILGGWFPKSKTEFTVVDMDSKEPTEHKLKTVVKNAHIATTDFTIGNENKDQPHAQRYWERWRYLKSIGIPSVTSMRVIEGDRILMGDMTADGSGFVGKETREDLVYGGRTSGVNKTELMFLKLDPEPIKAEIARLMDIAWKHGFVLPDDDEEYNLWIHPDGTWQVIVMDLSFINERTEAGLEEEKRRVLGNFDQMRDLLLDAYLASTKH